MTPVEFHFVTPKGVPLANTLFEIQLETAGFDIQDTGVVIPRLVEATTDITGKTVVALWPNVGFYHVTVEDPESKAALHYKFLVPEIAPGSPTTQVRLQDIVVNGELATTFDQAALLSILAAKAEVLFVRDEAQAVLANVAAQVTTATNAAAVASAAANTLYTDRTLTIAAAAAAAISATTATSAATVASAQATSASASATAASASLAGLSTELTQATAQAVIATAQATSATASAAAAAASANVFVTPVLQLATSMITTQAIVAQHHAFS